MGLALLVYAFFAVPFDRHALAYDEITSVRVTARDGAPLRTTLGQAETRAVWVPRARISPRMVEATLAAEDRRFYRHPGVDPVAVARAVLANLRAGRAVSGGSTLTQQLSGLLWPEPRTLSGKLREAVRALRLELALSKDEILEQYLNRAPYGPMIQGVGSASGVYFGISAEMLGSAQAATLAALPKAPGVLAAPESSERLRRRRDRILTAMERRGWLSTAQAQAARASALKIHPLPSPFRAPHFADWILAARGPELRRAARLRTTLDLRLQESVEAIVRAAQARRTEANPDRQVAVVVQAIPSGDVLAFVGSASWTDPCEGQVNAALAPRQPGSALKPFLYALAFDAGFSAADVLADVPLHALDAEGCEVSPRNFDGRFRGPVRARIALASSFNVPAVRLQQRLGESRVHLGLFEAGLTGHWRDAERFGLGLTLGVGEVTLLDLTNANVGLARGGEWRPPVTVLRAEDAYGHGLSLGAAPARRFCTPASAFLVKDILADDVARVPGFGAHSVLDLPFPVVVKTGTSTGFRDAWCVAMDGDHAVGVWTGNFDGSPVEGGAGARGAGPIAREILLHLHAQRSRPWAEAAPRGWSRAEVCALSGERPGPGCDLRALEWFSPEALARRPVCSFHRRAADHTFIAWPDEYLPWALAEGKVTAQAARLPSRSAAPRIMSPVNGSVYVADPELGSAEAVRFIALHAGASARWRLDGCALDVQRQALGTADLLWRPVPGIHVLEVMTRAGRDRVRFTVR